MNRSKSSLLVGAGLMLLGVLLLLQNLGVLSVLTELIWMGLFAVGGATFLGVYLADRKQWWPIIPGGMLLGIAAILALAIVWPGSGPIGGAVFFLAGGATFLTIFALHRENWWAVIPGGALLTIALVIALAQVGDGTAAGSVMLLGLAATFGVLSQVNTPDGRQRWALIPAAVLFTIGLLVLGTTAGWGMWVVSALLVLGGGLLVLKSVATRD